MTASFKHAVVIGGSMGGLLAARALAPHFERVTVLERDAISDDPVPRKGVPQGRHIHVLLEAGIDVLERLFPGLVEELEAEGAELIDTGSDVAWHHFGVWKTRFASGMQILLCSRPLLETRVRQRLVALQNVTLRGGSAVDRLLHTDDRARVTGVVLKDTEESLSADVVVDASGRGSALPRWLEQLGYARPEDETVGVDLAYASRIYRRTVDPSRDWKFLVQYPCSPGTWRGGFISSIEGDRWIVSLNGYFGDIAPTDDAGFLEYARSLLRPDLHAALVGAEPLSEISIHKVPSSRFRHYERLARFPEGILPFADAICAFNPVFGQGMSVAGKSAVLLDEQLTRAAQRSPPSLDGLPRALVKQLARESTLPWFLAQTLDLHYPAATGARPLGHGVLIWYVARLLELTSTNPAVYQELMRVLHLKAGLGAILKPSVSLPVLAYGLKGAFVALPERANTDTLPAFVPAG